MAKICASCQAKLKKHDKVCPVCGEKVLPAKDKSKTKNKKKAVDYAKNLFVNTTAASKSTAEIALPINSVLPVESIASAGLFSVLFDGIKSLISGLQSLFKDKKRLVLVIVLIAFWLVISVLNTLNIFPQYEQVLSFLTAANSDLIGGTIGKGIIAAFFAQFIFEKGIFKNLRNGLIQLFSITKKDKNSFSPILLGAGIALLVSNLITPSIIENAMISLAGFLLSAKALASNGYLKRLVQALPFQRRSSNASYLMEGWTIGFGLFVAISFVPGIYNGYIAGAICIVVSIVLKIVNK